MLQEAKAYNKMLAQSGGGYTLSKQQEATYESILDVTGTGIMGYIEIPTIHISLPIYHGIEDSVLQIAVGHLEWSSLPVAERVPTVSSPDTGDCPAQSSLPIWISSWREIPLSFAFWMRC